VGRSAHRCFFSPSLSPSRHTQAHNQGGPLAVLTYPHRGNSARSALEGQGAAAVAAARFDLLWPPTYYDCHRAPALWLASTAQAGLHFFAQPRANSLKAGPPYLPRSRVLVCLAPSPTYVGRVFLCAFKLLAPRLGKKWQPCPQTTFFSLLCTPVVLTCP
jgi:hypothetical protein